MSATHNLRLPASELSKLAPSRTCDRAPSSADVVRLPTAPDAVPAVTARRPRPTHHLSGFARA